MELLNKLIKSNGYFGLVCFAWGENCAAEVDDIEFYQTKCSGVAFRKEGLEEFFNKYFTMIGIRKYENGIPNTIQGLDCLWTCLF